MKSRLKTHDMPGDIPQCEKEAMLEGRHPDRRRAKSYRKMLRTKERAVLRERARNEIKVVFEQDWGDR